tara:strand:- start:337 stop:852 length:516 start_codon:yes stop_codon:yes gene_type:complete
MILKNKIGGLVYLIILLLVGSVDNLLPKQLTKYLSKNIFLRHILLFSIIFFTINFDILETNKYNDPTIDIIYSITTYLMFLLFTKLNLIFSIIIMFIIFFYYLLYKYKTFFLNKSYNSNFEKNYISVMDKYSIFIFIFIIIILIIGNIKYYIKQKKDHQNFNIIKYIFGTN